MQKSVLEHIGKKKTLLNDILCGKATRTRPILRRNCLLPNATEGQMTELKEVEKRRRYCDLKKEAGDWKR